MKSARACKINQGANFLLIMTDSFLISVLAQSRTCLWVSADPRTGIYP